MDVEFTIKAKMSKRWVPYFMSMLDWMQGLGKNGMSRFVGIYCDGDGDFRPEFEADIEWELQEPANSRNGNVFFDAS